MKKLFDKYLTQSSTGKFVALAMAFLLLIVIGGVIGRSVASRDNDDNMTAFGRPEAWGFMQCVDGGFVQATIGNNTKMKDGKVVAPAPMSVILLSLGFWLGGMIIYSFITGSIVDALRNRQEKIAAGHVRYRHRDHGIVVGWDFQGVATVLAMLDRWKLAEVVVLSEQPAEKIRGELSSEIPEKKLGRVFICNGSVGNPEDLASLCAGRAKRIVILGDQNETNNDGGNMRLSIRLSNQIEKEIKKLKQPPAEPVRMFVDVTGLHALHVARAHQKGGYEWPHVSVRIVNFFEEAAYELFSSVSRLGDENEKRVTLHFRADPDATHAHLIVAGFDEMAQALVLHAARILGSGGEPDRITVFTPDEATVVRFRGTFPVDRLLGVCVEFVAADIADPAQAKHLANIVRDMSASVTLAVCGATPDEALETFSALPRALRFENICVLMEQRCLEKWTWTESALRWMGYADVHFFGFTDRYLASVDDRDAIFHALSPDKVKDADYNEPAIAPAFLETMAVCGFVPRKSAPPHAFSDEELERLARTAQNSRANRLLLDGREPGAVSVPGLFRSARIRSWDELAEIDRKHIIEEWRKTIPLLDGILASAEKPLHLVHNSPALRIGILPSGRPLWRNKKDHDDFVSRVGSADKTLRADAKLDEKAMWPEGTVISADATDPESMKFVQWYGINRVRFDAILPASMEECASRIADSDEREDFLRTLRCAWVVTVAPDGDIAACIRSRASIVADLGGRKDDEP